MIIRSGEEDEEKIGFGYEFGSVKLGYEITTEENSVTTRLDNIKNAENPTGIFEKTSTTDALGRTVSEVLEEIRSGSKISATYEYVRGTVTDANGSILTESRKRSYSSKPLALSESYSYDALGQLVRHDSVSQNKTFVFEYDKNGNILSKKEYSYTTGSLPSEPVSSVVYGYSDASWKDKLTSYNGKEITYDANGNPLSYRDGISLSWNGRRLASFNSTTRYTYNEDGIRVMKNFGGIKTRYLLDGTNIIAQEVTNGDSLDYIYFFYDAAGSPVGMNYLGNNYFYKKNLQGDIIEIWGTEDGTDNHTFRLLVEYTYDAWGNVTKMLDQTNGWYRVGTANPFRYRGYYYDNESGFYYLQSRYYDPVTGRWLNPEPNAFYGEFDEGAKLLKGNLYAYCANSTIIYKDDTGEGLCLALCIIIGVVVGAAAGAAISKAIYGKVNGWWVLGGAVVGGVLGYIGGAFFGASGIKAGTLASKISMAKVRWVGKLGETLSKLPKNTKHIISLTNTAKYRIPDYLDKANKIIGDIKYVKYLSYTSQLKDFLLYAEKYGYTFFIKVRPSTQLSGTLKALVDAGKIVLFYFD